jgi:large subunit ribosomal protein L22
MEVKAQLRYLHVAPRKVRLVAYLLKGKTVQAAEAQLSFLAKRSARPLLKLLRSGMANAENNFKLKKDNLFVKNITVNEGPRLKRWQPRAFGRAAPIIKRSSHILLVLDERKPTVSKKARKVGPAAKPRHQPAGAKAVDRPVVDFKEIRQEAKGKPAAGPAADQPKKKFGINFKSIKDKFTRRLGER